MKIKSASLVKYNANTRGSSVGDCTARAISLAFNIDYSKARQALNRSAKENWNRNWKYNTTDNVRRVVESLGGSRDKRVHDKIDLNTWVDEHPSGTYILHCNKNGVEHGPGGHLVCVIDGRIYDSWDSRKCFVLSYHTINQGTKGADITDIGMYLRDWIRQKDADGYREYAQQIFDDIINKNRKLKKLADTYNVDYKLIFEVTKVVLENYTFKFGYNIYVKIPVYDYYRSFQGKFAIVFKPTMSSSEVEDYFNTTFYGKLYSFINGRIVPDIEDVCEGSKLLEHPDRELPPAERYTPYHYDSFSEKSFTKLPYWVRRLATNFTRRNPFEGEYHDSIELTINTPPFDTHYGEGSFTTVDDKTRYFHAYSMNDLIRGLEYYKKTGEYERAYEIAADF